MKKVLMMLCAVALLAMTACKKDDPTETVTPSGGNGGGGNGGTEQPEQVPQGEGIFSPSQKIDTIMIDGQVSEEWTWTDRKLSLIDKQDGYSEFQYSGWQVTGMTTIVEGSPVDVAYRYLNNKLSSVDAYSGTMRAVSINFNHNHPAGKISDMSLDINSTLLDLLSDFLGSDSIFNFFSSASKESSKFAIDTTVFNAFLTWQGDNVSRMILDGSITMKVTVGEARQVFPNFDTLLAAVASFLTDTNLKITLTIADTSIYTYDTLNNPFYGFLGALDVTTLSANNVTSLLASGVAKLASITVEVLFNPVTITQFPASIPTSIALPSRNMTYIYTYNNEGFPVTVTNSDGSVKQYIYKQ